VEACFAEHTQAQLRDANRVFASTGTLARPESCASALLQVKAPPLQTTQALAVKFSIAIEPKQYQFNNGTYYSMIIQANCQKLGATPVRFFKGGVFSFRIARLATRKERPHFHKMPNRRRP